MKIFAFNKRVTAAAAAVGLFYAIAGQAEAGYIQTNLVSDIAGLATITDPALVNSWGVSHSATSPFWVSNQGTQSATLYAVMGATTVKKITAVNPPDGVIAIPSTGAVAGPTGQVNNGTSSFLVGNGGNGKAAHFIFANLNGTISAWDTGPTAFVQPGATVAGAAYTGLATGSVGSTPYLYAADGTAGGSIQVFNGAFANVTGTTFAGKFVDPSLPAGLVPFNVQNIGGEIYVTYAPAGHTGEANAALGEGVVDVYDSSGTLIRRVITGSALAAPWGIVLAPGDFGKFANDLLVGNFSYLHSEINAFDPTTGDFKGSIPIAVGDGTAGGLWFLGFGTGLGNAGNADTLYFSDGINGETAGLFGAISVPEPSSLSLLAIGLAVLCACRLGSHRRNTFCRPAT